MSWPRWFKGASTFRARIFWSIIPIILSLLVLHGVMDLREHRQLVTLEFTKRGQAMAGNLAYSGELGVFAEDKQLLESSMRSVVGDPDVAYVFIYGQNGNTLARGGRHVEMLTELSAELSAGDRTRLFQGREAFSRNVAAGGERFIEFLAPIVSEQMKAPEELLIGRIDSGQEGSKQSRQQILGVVRVGLSLRAVESQSQDLLKLWGGITLLFFVLSTLVVYTLSRRITRPIKRLTVEADRIAHGYLDQKIPVESRDEIGQLASTFNEMAGALRANISEKERILAELQSLNRTLEQRIQERTAQLQERSRALERSLEEVRAMGEISRAVSSSLDLKEVLMTVSAHAVRLSSSDACGIFEVEPARDTLTAVSAYHLSRAFVTDLQSVPDAPRGIISRAAQHGEPIQFPDLQGADDFAFRDAAIREGYRALVVIPIGSGDVTRGLLLFRGQPGRFDDRVVSLLTTLANQSKVAIENARLFQEVQSHRAELEEKSRQLEKANRHKSEFLASMSHELRTPLNAIIGYSEMLQEEAEELGQGRFPADLEKIRAAGRHLLDLINAVLDLSKIEAGKMDLYLENFSITTMVDDIAAVIRPLAAKNSNQVEVHCDGDLGIMRADLTKLRQALFNLLSNACKFTEKGTVTLAVAREATETGDWLVFSVRDTGIGMTAEQTSRLFQEFSQVAADTPRKYGGTGLGLALSRRLCRMMGGDITVVSAPGSGSTFSIRLPANVDETVAEPVPAVPLATDGALGLAGTVLVIDDEAAVRDLLRRFLEKEGFRVVTAGGGVEGLRLAKALRPDAITLDVLMPGMDGWAVLSTLKADLDTATIPVIMLTIVDDKNLGFALGASDYLVKPIDRERLRAILNKYRRDVGGVGGPLTVLVVEDDEPLRQLMARMLMREGCTVMEAENGRIALARARETTPGLVLLDLMMPEMDGFEFVGEFRKHEPWRTVPIVVVTAKDLTEDERRRLSGYVQTILQKGSHTRESLLREVRDMVVAMIRRRES